MRLSDEQLRALNNAGQLHDAWKEVVSRLAQMPGGMYWRVINSREYLYEYVSTTGKQQTKYVGAKTPEIENIFREFKETRADLDARRAGIEARLVEMAPMWRALRLPAVDTTAGRILRAFDIGDFLGLNLLVVGTYALKAYEVEAAAAFSTGMDATDDLDFTLLIDQAKPDADLPRRLLLTLKQEDSSFIVSTASAKTLVNKNGYKIDLLTSTEYAKALASAIPWKPQGLEGQEWLVLGKPVQTVLIDFQGRPVAIAAPDPRYFALHKLWLSKRPGRPRAKAVKDENQGRALLQAVRKYMPHYPLDEKYVAKLPQELKAQIRDSVIG
ncbi:MAG: nucleotidyltransferase domain-containing protein [Burkholderiales bacterium]|nr:nucleotidyltransferase domain-containing protein [Burkholderiales bacterium]